MKYFEIHVATIWLPALYRRSLSDSVSSLRNLIHVYKLTLKGFELFSSLTFSMAPLIMLSTYFYKHREKKNLFIEHKLILYFP